MTTDPDAQPEPEVCPQCGNGSTYHNCGDQFHIGARLDEEAYSVGRVMIPAFKAAQDARNMPSSRPPKCICSFSICGDHATWCPEHHENISLSPDAGLLPTPRVDLAWKSHTTEAYDRFDGMDWEEVAKAIRDDARQLERELAAQSQRTPSPSAGEDDDGTGLQFTCAGETPRAEWMRAAVEEIVGDFEEEFKITTVDHEARERWVEQLVAVISRHHETITEAMRALYDASAHLRLRITQSSPKLQNFSDWARHTEAMRKAEQTLR